MKKTIVASMVLLLLSATSLSLAQTTYPPAATPKPVAPYSGFTQASATPVAPHHHKKKKPKVTPTSVPSGSTVGKVIYGYKPPKQ